jgi:hypothetical protein
LVRRAAIERTGAAGATEEDVRMRADTTDRVSTAGARFDRGLFGMVQRDVTPPEGIHFRNWGAATRDIARGVHRPFSVVVLTMRGRPDDDPLVLAGLDGGWWQHADDEWRLRGGVLDALDLPEDRLMINLSHTHAGPSLVTANADRPGGRHIGPYLDAMRDAIVEAAREALASEQRGELRWAVGRCDLATHRLLPDPEQDRFVTGFNPGGAADDTVLLGRISGRDGSVLGTVLNYACHPTTLAWDNELLSPDYIGAARDTVEAATGGAPCLFLLGACGELAPAHQYVGDVAVADQHGRRLGFAALSALESMMPAGQELTFDRIVESGAPLAVWLPAPSASASSGSAARRCDVELPIKSDFPTLADLRADLRSTSEGYRRERLERKARLRESIGDDDTYRFSSWVWGVGDTVFVGWPGEAFSVAQQRLRERFSDRTVVVMNVVNGSIGYLPPSELYGQDIYEVWQTPLERGSLERVLEACQDTIAQL